MGRGAGGGLTDWSTDGRAGLRSLAAALLTFVCLLGMPGVVLAARVAVVLSDDSAPYQEVYQAFRASFEGADHDIARLYADGLTSASLGDARLAIAVGVGAAEALAALPNRLPMLAVLVPKSWYVKAGRARISDGGRRPASAIFIDQSFERQAQLIRLAFPDARRVGVLVSADQGGQLGELEEALRAQRLSLVLATLNEGDRLVSSLENVLSEADVLLAVPDSQVLNRNTAQSVFLTTYRYRAPVIGYSRSLTRAGAMVSVYSSPAQVGRQTAEAASSALQGASVRLPPAGHPAYFTVSLNEQVARSLGFTLPPADELETRLGGTR